VITVQDICRIDLFEGLDRASLVELAEASGERFLEDGEVLVPAGEQVAALYCVLEGTVETYTALPGGREQRDKLHRAPTFLGVISMLTYRPMAVTNRAYGPTRIAVIPRQTFRVVMHRHPEVEERAMSVFVPTLQRINAAEQQREKLAALGTMSAGLAHELNNPAAAAKRSAQELAEALEVVQGTIARFVEKGVERETAAEILELERDALARAQDPPTLDALARSDAEDAIADRLEALGIDDPWTLSEPFAAIGVDGAWLDRLSGLAGPAAEAAVRWIAASLTARSLADDLRESTDRISALVGAIKEYTYMDQASEQDVDIHAGLESTLRILAHKVKHRDVEIRRDFADDLPAVSAHGSELNQVWTNLLDNAIDAVADGEAITISTTRSGQYVEVVIHNGGDPAPPEVLAHAFEPFFTTKDVGKGTGLGLQTAHRIVVDGHGGELSLGSDATGTAATVRLPIDAV
jgi:signal transduction histidine kinase